LSLDTPAGKRVMLYLNPSPSDRVPHHAKKMIKSFSGQEATTTAAEPAANRTIQVMNVTCDIRRS